MQKKHKIFIIAALFCFSTGVNAQINASEERRINSLIGKGFHKLPTKRAYPYSTSNTLCTYQPSATRKYDTSGVYFNNEFLLFRSPLHFKIGSEVYNMQKEDYVTVKEYQEFQNFVRDSIAREKIYEGIDEDEDAIKFLNIPEKLVKGIDPSDRSENRRKYDQNLDLKISYTDPRYLEFSADMYLNQPERLNRIRDFNERRFAYRYLDEYESLKNKSQDSLSSIAKILAKKNTILVSQYIPTLSDTYTWAEKSRSIRDEYSILAQVYRKQLLNEPIIGLSGMQANAFCHWKQEMIQKELDAKKLNYTVIVSLPYFMGKNEENSIEPNFTIEERDYTEQWQISKKEYNTFIEHVKDSLLREHLFEKLSSDKEALLMLSKVKSNFFYEHSLEYIKIPSLHKIEAIRYYFDLNYAIDISAISSEARELSKQFKAATSYIKPVYRYSYVDAEERSIEGELKVPNYLKGRYECDDCYDSLYLEVSTFDEKEEPIGKDRNLSSHNVLNQSSGVRSHEYFGRFNYTKTIDVLPSEETENYGLLENISYEQAMAFYHWKYPIHKIKPSDDWQKYVLPTEEQFNKVQRGEQVIVQSQKVAYPTPVFRYAVHFFPKN